MRVLFDFSRQQIAIEGNEPELVELLQVVREIAPALSDIRINMGRSDAPATPGRTLGNGSQSSVPSVLHSGQTLRQFIKSLSLSNISERIAAIAYYVKTHEGKESFAPKEMGTWFTICGFPKPNQMPVAVYDSKKRYGYTENVGHGKWRLTTNGENLVVGKINEVEAEAN